MSQIPVAARAPLIVTATAAPHRAGVCHRDAAHRPCRTAAITLVDGPADGITAGRQSARHSERAGPIASAIATRTGQRGGIACPAQSIHSHAHGGNGLS